MSEIFERVWGAVVTVFLLFVALAIADHFLHMGLVKLLVDSIHTATGALKAIFS